MSVWSTKSSGRDRDYILLQHPLRGVNYIIKGVKFRESYAVVEKDSKTYNELLKMPLLKTCKEHDISFLSKLRFITRTTDIKTVYGEDVYRCYVNKLEVMQTAELIEQKKIEEIQHLEGDLCKFRTPSEELCRNYAIKGSPSEYCIKHVLDDPKLIDLGITVPKFMPKDDRVKFRDKVIKKLEKK